MNDAAIRCELEPNYVLNEEERSTICDAFNSIEVDPYRQYSTFVYQVDELVKQKRIPLNVVNALIAFANGDQSETPFVFIRNMPVDVDVPFFDNEKPVSSKYELKKTFVAEASLALVANLLGQTPIGYLNVNGGDVFQDIYPAKSMSQTQSQKALGPIYFHKDLANHYVRPDFVNMLSLRSSEKNSIYTTFVKNIDIFSLLTPSEIEEFRKPQFHTPFDDLTVLSGNHDVGEAEIHPIISDELDIRHFENRTEGIDARSKALVEKLNRLLHESKKAVQMCPGDFIGVANNYSLHGKEVGNLAAPDEAWNRWTMKTVNVMSVEPHKQYLVSGSNCLIAG